MFRIRFLCLLLALFCLVGAATVAKAADVDCDATYCFTATDFTEKENLTGICITQLPDAAAGTVMLGNRVIRSGDILTADQLAKMTFCPLRTQEDQDAVVTYLPIFQNRVEPSATMTISIRGKEDKAPVAQDSALETYKNLPNQGNLNVSDPEGEKLTYTLARQPKRGQVAINDDGTFLYTPKKNKVGVDSFTFTAADPSGNVSREATVTIQILKPTDSKQYTDTVGQSCRFAAEWMRNTGLFTGEQIGGEHCFQPEKAVNRGEFLAMVVKALDIPLEEAAAMDMPEDTPNWLKPYLAAATRAGMTAGWPEKEAGAFLADQPITGAEAAVMLQNVLDLSISQQTMESATEEVSAEDSAEEIPAWAAVALTAMSENGIQMQAAQALTRADLAQVMYQVSRLAINAPGMAVIRMQD